MDKELEIYCKYFPVTQIIKEDIVDGGKKDKDKMALYVHEVNEIDVVTGKSLVQEIEYQRSIVDRITSYLNDMSETLSKMHGIEYKLYYEIAVKGVSVSKAVSNIAEIYNKDNRTIWKYHYKKIKKEVGKLKKYSENS